MEMRISEKKEENSLFCTGWSLYSGQNSVKVKKYPIVYWLIYMIDVCIALFILKKYPKSPDSVLVFSYSQLLMCA